MPEIALNPPPFNPQGEKGEIGAQHRCARTGSMGINFPLRTHFHPIPAILESQPFAGLRVVDPDEQAVRRSRRARWE